MMQTLMFDTAPTAYREGASHHVVNASTGIGMRRLKQNIKRCIPVVNNNRVITRKRIIRTDRYECSCCGTTLTALIQVDCGGFGTFGRYTVQGLYKISMTPDRGRCKITVEKLSGTTIGEGRVGSSLPRKRAGAGSSKK